MPEAQSDWRPTRPDRDSRLSQVHRQFDLGTARSLCAECPKFDQQVAQCCAYMAMGQNLVPLVHIKIVGAWVFTPLTLIKMGFDTHSYLGEL